MAESASTQALRRKIATHERALGRIETLHKDLTRAERLIHKGDTEKGLELLESVLGDLTEELATTGNPVASALNAVRKDV